MKKGKGAGCAIFALILIVILAIAYVSEDSSGASSAPSFQSSAEVTPPATYLAAYNAKDPVLTKQLHDGVGVVVEIGKVGLLGTKKGIIVTISNYNKVGVVNSVKFKYSAFDPFGELLSKSEQVVTDLSIGPGESKSTAYEVKNIFGGNPLEEAERIEYEVLQIKWSNGIVTE